MATIPNCHIWYLYRNYRCSVYYHCKLLGCKYGNSDRYLYSAYFFNIIKNYRQIYHNTGFSNFRQSLHLRSRDYTIFFFKKIYIDRQKIPNYRSKWYGKHLLLIQKKYPVIIEIIHFYNTIVIWFLYLGVNTTIYFIIGDLTSVYDRYTDQTD